MKTAPDPKAKGQKVTKKKSYQSADTKLKAIQLSKSGKTKSEISREIGVSFMTVSDWIKNQDNILEQIENAPDCSTSKVSRSRPIIMEKLEKVLLTWIEDCNQLKWPLSLTIIQGKAQSIFKKLKSESEENVNINFTARRG